MKILVSGATGLVGGALVPRLINAGHDVRPLVREGQRGANCGISWSVTTGDLDQSALKEWGGPDAVVHLAGENVAGGRWTRERKRRIRESRVEATERLVQNLLPLNLKVFVGASAIGIYGDRGEETLTEASPRGTGFLADVSAAWEAAAQPLGNAGVRVAHLRFGMILSRQGGALRKMLPIFRLGLGGKLGSGQQWVSWIALADAVRALEFALNESHASGPFNAVAPAPVRNADFTNALAKTVHRPALLPAPAFALRVAFGELADAALLASQKVLPERLLKSGFRFKYPDLAGALSACV